MMNPEQAVESRPKFPEIAAEIIRMAEEDQAERFRVFNDPDLMADPEKRRVIIVSIDARNTDRLDRIIADIGWPSISKVGPEASTNAWLIAQHADEDPSFQERCLELMKAEHAGEVEKQNIAYLEDRVMEKKEGVQIYGTQFEIDGSGNYGPKPIKDPENLEERRRTMGMESFQEYREGRMRWWEENKHRYANFHKRESED